MIKVIGDRRATSAMMFALFAGVLALGILSMSQKVHTVVAAQISKPATQRY